MYIYAFGSVCRGEVTPGSDVDLLAIIDDPMQQFDASVYSVYTSNRIKEIWKEGNPFAWHLHLESKVIFSKNGDDFLSLLGSPNSYIKCKEDCEKFFALFINAQKSLNEGGSDIFDLSTIFLSVRNFATCYSLGMLKKPDFSRGSALNLENFALPVSKETYQILERARILCTRGYGVILEDREIKLAGSEIGRIPTWMHTLMKKVEDDERI
jgi:hypothetical protein